MDEINFYHRHRFLQGLENLNFKGSFRLVNLLSWFLLPKPSAYRFFMLRKGKGRISSLIELQETTPIPPFNNIFCLLEEHIESLPAQLLNP